MHLLYYFIHYMKVINLNLLYYLFFIKYLNKVFYISHFNISLIRCSLLFNN